MEGQHIPSGMYRVTQVGKKEVRYKRKNRKVAYVPKDC